MGSIYKNYLQEEGEERSQVVRGLRNALISFPPARSTAFSVQRATFPATARPPSHRPIAGRNRGSGSPTDPPPAPLHRRGVRRESQVLVRRSSGGPPLRRAGCALCSPRRRPV